MSGPALPQFTITSSSHGGLTHLPTTVEFVTFFFFCVPLRMLCPLPGSPNPALGSLCSILEELALCDRGAPSLVPTTPKGHLHHDSGSTTEYPQLFLSAS